jgi:flavodoxin
MKSLVVYYSFEGNTRKVANLIANYLNSDIIELKLLKDILSKNSFMKYAWGGKQVVMKEKPPIEDININFNDYDLIIIGTPIWAFSFTPAIRTFFSKYKITNKQIGLFCTHEGGLGKTFDHMKKELTSNEIISEQDFLNVLKQDNNELENNVKTFINKLNK